MQTIGAEARGAGTGAESSCSNKSSPLPRLLLSAHLCERAPRGRHPSSEANRRAASSGPRCPGARTVQSPTDLLPLWHVAWIPGTVELEPESNWLLGGFVRHLCIIFVATAGCTGSRHYVPFFHSALGNVMKIHQSRVGEC